MVMAQAACRAFPEEFRLLGGDALASYTKDSKESFKIGNWNHQGDNKVIEYKPDVTIHIQESEYCCDNIQEPKYWWDNNFLNSSRR